jgi:hypothetical protein
MSERATVRPVTLARLAEATHACEDECATTDDLSAALDVTERRARETILEALRIGLLEEYGDEQPSYDTTYIGGRFLDAIRNEDWTKIDDVLAARSPHYQAFVETLKEIAPAQLSDILTALEADAEFTPYDYNQTSVEVVGDWAERLGRIQRNAFTGGYYPVERDELPANFPHVLLDTYDELEETAGVSLRQRYLSIPELREQVCERLRCRRDAFDEGLQQLAKQNVGKLELSGAPMDTGAKEAELGIKRIELADADDLVSTSQSTDDVMRGVEQFGKQYYYLAVYDRDLTFDNE